MAHAAKRNDTQKKGWVPILRRLLFLLALVGPATRFLVGCFFKPAWSWRKVRISVFFNFFGGGGCVVLGGSSLLHIITLIERDPTALLCTLLYTFGCVDIIIIFWTAHHLTATAQEKREKKEEKKLKSARHEAAREMWKQKLAYSDIARHEWNMPTLDSRQLSLLFLQFLLLFNTKRRDAFEALISKHPDTAFS